MSTWIYLRCEDHDPPLSADGESGQHLYDLPQIRADIANRDAVVAAWQDDLTSDDHFRRNTARFLTQHPKCRIGIMDEYGRTHPLTDKPEEPLGLGAVVVDRNGDRYTRYDERDPQPWWWNTPGPDAPVARRYAWTDLDAAEVLSEGVR